MMNNDNLNPDENNKLDAGADEAEVVTGAGDTSEVGEATQVAEATQVVEPTEPTEPTEPAQAMEVTPEGDALGVVPIAPVKKKTALIAGVVAAVLAVAAVVSVVIVMQSPERVVKSALSSSFSQMEKQSEQIIADIPAMARQAELAKGGTVNEMSLKLNALQIPGLNPIIATLFSGTTVSGTTTADTVNNTYSNSYGLTMMGQKLGTLDLYTTPTTLSLGMPEFFAGNYYLNMDSLVENGWDSYLFSELVPTKKDDLQLFSDLYSSYIKAIGSVNDETTKQMTKRMQEICIEQFTGFTYGKDGDLYTVTVPAQSVNGALAALTQYIYLESPMMEQMVNLLPAEDRTEFLAEINNLGSMLAVGLPQTPTVITLDIKNGKVLTANIATQGTSLDGTYLNFLMKVDLSDVKLQKVELNFEMDDGIEKIVMDMKAHSSYSDKVMDGEVEMNLKDGNGQPLLLMHLFGRLDGNITTNNMEFSMNYLVSTPTTAGSMDTAIFMEAQGDYFLKDDAVVLNMPELDYNIVSGTENASITLNMNLGVESYTAPFTGTLAQPEGIDILTLREDDLIALTQEANASLEKMLSSFMGGL